MAATAEEAQLQPHRTACSRCGQEVLVAPMRNQGRAVCGVAILEVDELEPARCCPHCKGRGTRGNRYGRGGRYMLHTCERCCGSGRIGQVLAGPNRFVLDERGYAKRGRITGRGVKGLDRPRGCAAHREHRCE